MRGSVISLLFLLLSADVLWSGRIDNVTSLPNQPAVATVQRDAAGISILEVPFRLRIRARMATSMLSSPRCRAMEARCSSGQCFQEAKMTT